MVRILLFLSLCISSSYGGFDPPRNGARGGAMGRTGMAMAGDPWAAIANPATLGFAKHAAAACFVAPDPFGLGELSESAAIVVFNTPLGPAAVAGRRFGFDLYRESTISLSYGLEFQNLALGVSINQYRLEIDRYGSASTFGLCAGVVVPVSKHLQWGIVFTNLNRPLLGESKEVLGQAYSAGCAYMPLLPLTFNIEYTRESGFDPYLHMGCEYSLLEQFSCRLGYVEQPAMVTGGIGLTMGDVSLDYAYQTHEYLGGTHELSLTVRLGRIGGSHE